MFESTDAGRAVCQPISRLARSMRDAALLIGGGLARTPKLWRRLGDFSLLLALAGSTILVLNHTSGAAPKAWYYMSGGYGGGYGSPNYDSDADGIPDAQDVCPLAAGSPGCAGCPDGACGDPQPFSYSSSDLSLWCSEPGYGTTQEFWELPFPYGAPLANEAVQLSLRVRPGSNNTAFVSVFAPGVQPGYGQPLVQQNFTSGSACDDFDVSLSLPATDFNSYSLTNGYFRIRVSHAYWNCNDGCAPRVQLSLTGTGTTLPTTWGDPDGDGFPNFNDRCPLAYGECDGCPPESSPDSDGDGTPDCFDDDDDGDGIPDWSDRCPLVFVAYGESDCLGCPPAMCDPRQVSLDLGTQYLPCGTDSYGEPLTSWQAFWFPAGTLPASDSADVPVRLSMTLTPGQGPGAEQFLTSRIANGFAPGFLAEASADGPCTPTKFVFDIAPPDFNRIRVQNGAFDCFSAAKSSCSGCSPSIALRVDYLGYGQPLPGSDDDGDGIPIELDRCPLAVGPCQGCPCTDTDDDGEADAFDLDDDGDGVPDIRDAFPLDSDESSDSDGDGLGDQADGCPLDPLKSVPGACGCGVADADTDGDMVADCVDVCPADPTKSTTNVCGCGVPDLDLDGDGDIDCPLTGGLPVVFGSVGSPDDANAVAFTVGQGPFVQLAGGDGHAVGLRSDGSVRAWGYNGSGQTNIPADLGPCTAIAAGAYHTVALQADGTVRAWGYNLWFQTHIPGDLGPCTAIAAGSEHTVAIQAGGTVRAWGANFNGQTNIPTDLGSCKAIAAGAFHTVAIRDDGFVRAWGRNDWGQSNIPSDLGTCTAIAAGFDHTVALRTDGTVRVWGYNEYGITSVPVDLGICTAIAAGHYHCVALQEGGTVRAWGYNNSGQTNIPAGLGRVNAIAAGPYFTLVANEPDCNGDGQSDIPQLALNDIDWDGVLDSCEVAAGATDCDGDQVPDASQVARRVDRSRYLNSLPREGASGQLEYSAVERAAPGSLVRVSVTSYGGDYGGGVANGEFLRATIAGTELLLAGTKGFTTVTADIPAAAFNAAINAYALGALPIRLESGANVDFANDAIIRLEYSVGAVDCNQNGVPDACDIASGTQGDCDQDGSADACEVDAAPIALQAGFQLPCSYPSSSSGPQTITLTAPKRAIVGTTVQLVFNGSGDLRRGVAGGEYLQLQCGDVSVVLEGNPQQNCQSATITATVPAEQFNAALLADGTLQVTITPGYDVDCSDCGNPFGDFTIAYVGVDQATDCNLNGVPDDCDIDLNSDGTPDDCVAPADSDGDGTPDSLDGCPQDPSKTVPGACGCGVSDADTDGDGTPDCNDGCPEDPSKTSPGSCGCGTPDADSDGDGVLDCVDPCPSTTGPCGGCPQNSCGGCGAAADSDGDGTPDCNDGCPNDPGKTSAGSCGCGNPEIDSDADGVADCVDLCPNVGDPLQLDCDGDGTGDACEGAPDCNGNQVPDSCDLTNGTSTDADGDTVPDSCQPDCNGNSLPDAWELATGQQPDCNGNGAIDSCDVTAGRSQDTDGNGEPDECAADCDQDGTPNIVEIAQGATDCNGNQIPDLCEDGSRRSDTGNMGRVGAGVTATGSLTGQSYATTPVALTVTARADVGAANEWLTLSLNGIVIPGSAGTQFLFGSNGVDCPAENQSIVTIPAATWRQIIDADGGTGTVAISVSGSVAVNADQCTDPLLTASVSYGGPLFDCDGNSVVDLCEISSGLADCNGNLVHDTCEIASGTAADIDGNGTPDACQEDCDGNSAPDAYELSQAPGLDCTGNGVLDRCDISSGLEADCDLDGTPDSCEFATGDAVDCNSNGVPDACDLVSGAASDCNANGVPDSCDIVAGSSNDVDQNGIPDECKTDCNANGLPDAYEIAQGSVPDCNGNGAPDGCDLASGTERDCNANQVPDSCDIAAGDDDKDGDGRIDACEFAAGDFDLSGVIDGADLSQILSLWGSEGAPIGDLDGDGAIGGGDLAIVLANWGVQD